MSRTTYQREAADIIVFSWADAGSSEPVCDGERVTGRHPIRPGTAAIPVACGAVLEAPDRLGGGEPACR